MITAIILIWNSITFVKFVGNTTGKVIRPPFPLSNPNVVAFVLQRKNLKCEKYIKQTFADSRIYVILDNLLDYLLARLERKGNRWVHEVTKNRPEKVYALEKQHLIPAFSLPSFESTYTASISRFSHKDNTVVYQNNRYSLPLASYQAWPNKRVLIDVSENEWHLIHHQTLEGIASHSVCYVKRQANQKSAINVTVLNRLKDWSNRSIRLSLQMKSLKPLWSST